MISNHGDSDYRDLESCKGCNYCDENDIKYFCKASSGPYIIEICSFLNSSFHGHCYFFLKILETEHDRKESQYCLRVPPVATAHQARTSKPVLRPVPGHVRYHRPGEPSHPRPHLPGPPPPHTHVFVSQ